MRRNPAGRRWTKTTAQVLLLFLFIQVSFSHVVDAQMIVPDGLTDTLVTPVPGTNVTNVTTSTLIGDGTGGLNSFQRFNVDPGHTVNLLLPAGASVLVNLVHEEASQIQGVLNAVQGERIGGKIYFLNPHGIVISQSGVVNVGALQILTPTESFMRSFDAGEGEVSSAAVAAVLEGTVPVSPLGLVRVDGHINAVSDVVIDAGKVEVRGTIGTGAVFDVRGLHFTDVVNLSGLEAGSYIASENGQIQIVAAGEVVIDGGMLTTDGAPGVDAASITVEAGSTVRIRQGALISAKGHGATSKDGSVVIRAVSRAFDERTGAEAGAHIDVQGGEIRGGSITLTAEAEATYEWKGLEITPVGALYVTFDDEPLQGIAALRSGAGSSVNIAGTAVLDASGPLSLEALSKTKLATHVIDAAGTGLNLGFAYGELDSQASVDVAAGASLSGSQVTASARNVATLDLNLEASTWYDSSIEAAVAIGVANVQSSVRFAKGASVSTPGAVVIRAENTNQLSAQASAIGRQYFTTDPKPGNVGMAGAFYFADTAAKALLETDLVGVGSVSVTAHDRTEERQIRSNTATADQPLPIKYGVKGGVSAVNTATRYLNKANQTKSPRSESGASKESLPAVAAAVTIADASQQAVALVGSGVRIEAGGPVNVEAKVYDHNPRIYAASGNSTQHANLSVSAAVAYGDFLRDAQALIGDGAVVRTAALNVSSRVDVPYEFTWHKWEGFSSILDKMSAIAAGLDRQLSGFANAQGNADDVGLAGSVLYVTHDNRSEALVGRGAQVVVDSTASQNPAVPGAVAVNAATHVSGIFGAGNIHLSLKGTGEADYSVGGAYSHTNVWNQTRALIAEGVTIGTAEGDPAANVSVNAASQERVISLAPTAGRDTGIGLNGAVAYANVDTLTVASVDDEALVDAEKLAVTAEDDVLSWMVTGAINQSKSAGVGFSIAINDVTGSTRAFIGDGDALLDGGSQRTAAGKVTAREVKVEARTDGSIETWSVGLSAALNSKDGSVSWKDKVKSAVTSGLTAAGNWVWRKIQGSPESVADASSAVEASGGGALPTGQKPSEGEAPPESHQGPQFGIAVSGSASVNQVDLETMASIDGAAVEIDGGSGAVSVGAVNDTDIGALSGGGALTRANNENSNFSVGVTGSLAVNLIENRTIAHATGSTVTGARHVDVFALAGGDHFAVAAGLPVNLSGDQSQAGTGAGSVSISIVANETRAGIAGSSIEGAGDVSGQGGAVGDVDVVAYDRTRLGTGGGALMAGGRLALGAAVSYASVANTTEASVRGSSLSRFAGVRAQALNAALIGTAAAMGGLQWAEDGADFAGSFAIAEIENVTRSAVESSTVTGVTDVSVVARDTTGEAGLDALIDSHDCRGEECPEIAPFLDLTGAGVRQDGSIDQAMAAAAASAGGSAAGTASQGNDAAAGSGGPGQGGPPAGDWTQAASGFLRGGTLGGSSIVSVAGSLQIASNALGISFVWNNVANEFRASIAGSTIEAAGRTEVRSSSDALIAAIASGLGVSEKLSGGGSVAINQIRNTTTADVASSVGSLVDTGMLHVAAEDRSEINAGAGNAGLNWSNGTGSGGVTVAFSGINNTVRATVSGYDVESVGEVRVEADNASVIRTVASAAAASSGGTAIAGSGAFAEIGNLTEAAVVSTGARTSSVQAGGLVVAARDGAAIISVAGQLAFTSGKAAVGGSTSVNWVTNQTRALLENADVTATGAVEVSARSETAIGAGAASGESGDAAAVNGSATVSVVVNTTEALVRSDKGNALSAGSLAVTAHDASVIFAGAGQVGIAGKAAVGGAVVHGQVQNRTRAALSGAVATVGGQARLAAGSTAWIVSVGASGGVSNTAAVNGSITSSFIGNETVAEVTAGSGSGVTAGAVTISAQDQSIVGTLSGQLGVSGNTAVGGAATVNYIGNTTRARAAVPRIQTPGDLVLDAQNEAWIVAGALAGLGGSQAAVGASVTTSVIDNATEAELLGVGGVAGAGYAARSVRLKSQDDSKIFTIAGQLGGASNAAVGAGAAVAVIANATKSRIVDAEVQAQESVAVEAESRSLIVSVGVSGQGASSAAVGASNTTHTISNTTVAEVVSSSGRALRGGSLRVRAWDQAQLYTLAGQLAGSGNVAVGGAVAVSVVASETRATVAGVDVDVLGETGIDARQNALLITAAASGAGAGEVAVAAGVATSIVSNTTLAEARAAGRTVRSGSLSLQSRDDSAVWSLAGQASGAGSAAVGGAAAHNQIANDTRAALSGGAIEVGSALTIAAGSTSTIRTLAASGGVSASASVDGSVASSHVNNTTEAELAGSAVTGATSQVTVQATDEASIASISGAPAAAASGAGVGIAMSVNQIGSTTRARMRGGSAEVGNLLVRGQSRGSIQSIAASIGLAAVGAGVAGSTAINLINNDTLAGIDEGAAVLARGNAGVIAWSDDQVTNAAGVIAGAGKGAGVGLSATVNEIGGRTAAYIAGADTSVTALAGDGYGSVRIANGLLASQPDLEGALQVQEITHFDPTIDLPSRRRTADVRGVAVNASATHHVQNYVANAAGGFWTGASGLANVNLIMGTTEAYVDAAQINRMEDGAGGAAQSVHVGASDHAFAHDYVLSGAAGVAGVGMSVSATGFERTTRAAIDGSGEIRAAGGVFVDARASQSLASVVGGAGAGGFGGAGSASIAIVSGITEARLRDTSVYAGDVNVGAHSASRLFTSAGTAAGAGLAAAGAIAISVDQGTSRALLERSQIETSGQVDAVAQSDTEIQTWSASGSGGGTAGLAGSGAVSIVKRRTEALSQNSSIGAADRRAGGFALGAVDRVTVKNRAGAVGAGSLGFGGVTALTSVGNVTTASMQGGAAYVQGAAAVEAESERYLSTLAASGGLGGAALAANVALILAGAMIPGDVSSELNSSGWLAAMTGFASEDRVVTGGSNPTLQLALDRQPPGGADAPVTVDDLARVRQTAQIDVDAMLGPSGATAAGVYDGATIDAVGDVAVRATTRDRAGIIAGGALLGATAAFGASVGVVDLAHTVEAAADSAASLVSHQGAVRVAAGADRWNRYDSDDLLCDPARAVGVCAYQGGGGSIAAGAAVAVATLDNVVRARVGSTVNLTSHGPGGIAVQATDAVDASATAHGYQLGFVAAGAVVATATRRGNVQSMVGLELPNQTPNMLRATQGSVSIVSRRQGSVEALTVAGAGGVQGNAVGSGATAEDGGHVQAIVGNRVTLEALQGTVEVGAYASPSATATARGYGGSLFATVGASVAVSKATPVVEAVVGSEGAIRAHSLGVYGTVTISGAHTARSFAEAGGVGLLAGANASVSEAQSTSVVNVSVASPLEIAGDAVIGATNATRQQAIVTGVVGGVAALGASVATATAGGTTKATLTSQSGGNVGGRLTLSAAGNDETFSQATSGSGGVVAGAAGVANTGNTSETVAELAASAGIQAGSIDVVASHMAAFDGKVNTLQASVVGMSGAISVHDVNSRVRAAIAPGVRLQTRDLTVMASNRTHKLAFSGSGYSVEAGSGGIVDAAAAAGNTTVRHETDVVLGQGAQVDVIGSWADPGRTNFLALNEVKARDAVRLDSGGAISVAHADSRIQTDLVGRATIDRGASVTTVGDLNVGVRTEAYVRTEANAKTYGASGAASGHSVSRVTATERVRVGQGASIVTRGNANFYAGRDTDGRENDIGAIANTDLFNKTALPISTAPAADAEVNRTATIDIEGGASVRTVGDIYLLTENGYASADGKGRGTDLYRSLVEDVVEVLSGQNVSLEIRAGKSLRNVQTGVTVQGALDAGIHSKQYLVIGPGGNAVSQSEGIQFTVTHENLAVNLIQHLQELYALRAAYGMDPSSAAAFDAEINFVIQQLRDMGYPMTNPEEGAQFIADSFNVQYINVSDTLARGGSIVVTGGYLAGSGSVKAASDPQITIENQSSSFLRLGRLLIDDSGGRLLYNGIEVSGIDQIRQLNRAGSPAANLALDVAGTSPNRPAIHVANTYIPPGGQLSSPIPDIDVTGDIVNFTGTVTISNARGNIKIAGTAGAAPSITANTVHLEAYEGSIMQSYHPGVIHVGGDPRSIWADVAALAQGAYAERDVWGSGATLDTIVQRLNLECGFGIASSCATLVLINERRDQQRLGQGSIIAGNNILLSARYLNINGLIQSGLPERVVPGADFPADRIQIIKQQWEQSGRPAIADVRGNPLYRLWGGGNTGVDVYFDPSTERIVVDNIQVRGGYVELYGEIINTGGGRIRALDGYGRIQIDTSSLPYDVVVYTLDTGHIEGIVRITDLAYMINGVPRTTEYQRVGDRVRTRQWRGDQLLNESVATSPGRTATYTPEPGTLYVWKRGQDFTSTYVGTRTESYWFDLAPGGSAQYDSWTLVSSGGAYDLPEGQYARDGSQTTQYYLVGQDLQTGSLVRVSHETWSECSILDLFGWCIGERTYYVRDTYKQGIQKIYTHSLKADHPIPVEFIGYDEWQSSIDIRVGGNLILNGTVRHLGGEVQLKAGESIVQTSEDVRVIGRSIGLTSDGGSVGGAAPVHTLLEGTAGFLQVSAAAGDAAIRDHSNSLRILTASAKGNLTIEAEGTITSSQLISAERISLVSKTGQIGAGASAPLLIRAGTGALGGFSAAAQGDIAVRQVEGDLQLITVESIGGDVWLEAAGGSIVDGNRNEARDQRTIEQLEKLWSDMLLLEGEGAEESAQATLDAYRAARESEYHLYWRLRGVRPVFGADGNVERYEWNDFHPSQAEGWMDAQRYAELHEAFGSQPFDPDFRYTLTAAEQAELTEGYAWTREQLQTALPGSILFKRTTSTETRVEDPNVIGRNVTLIASAGSVGTDRGQIVITSPDQLKDPEVRLALLAAEVDDVAVDEETGTVTVLLRDTVDVAATGQIEVQGRDHVYLGSRRPIYVQSVTSGGSIRIKGTDGLFDVSIDEAAVRGGSGDLILEGGDGGIGTAERPFTIALQPGTSLTARAAGDIYVRAGLGALHVSQIYSLGNVYLEAAKAITSTGQAPVVIQGQSIHLKAHDGDIGTSQLPMAVQPGLEGVVSADAARASLYVRSSGASLTNFGLLSAGNELVVTAAGNLRLNGAVTGLSVRLTASGAISQADTAGITAQTLETASGFGQSLVGSNAVDRLLITNGSGDVMFHQAGTRALRLVGIEQAGGSVSIVAEGTIVVEGLLRLGSGGTRGHLALTTGASLDLQDLDIVGVDDLHLSAEGGVMLTGQIDAGRISVVNAGGERIYIEVTAGNPVFGDIDQLDGGSVTLIRQGSITLGGMVRTVDGVIMITSGTLSAAGNGRIIAGYLETESKGGVSLGGLNRIGRLTVINDGGAVTLANAGNLEIAGITQASGGDITLTHQGAVLISGVIETTGAVQLTATGSIAETGDGRVEAASLAAQSAGGLSLGGDNRIGRFTATNAGGAVTFTNEAAILDLAAISQTDGGDVVVSNLGAITVSGAVETTGAVQLAATGAIGETASGRVVAASLTTESAGGLDLGGLNRVGRLTAINDGGAVRITNAADLEIGGLDQKRGGGIVVAIQGDLVISGHVETSDSVSLAATGSISEAGGGRIVAARLATDSAGGVHLAGSNRLGVFTAVNRGGSLTLHNAGNLELAGINQVNGGDVVVSIQGAMVIREALETTGAAGLTATGSITQAGDGRIAAASLTLHSAGGIDLGGNNQIARFTATNNGGAVYLSNTGNVEVAGIGQINGGDVTVSNTGSVTIGGAVETSGTVRLTVNGSVTETGAGRIVAAALAVESAGGLGLSGNNRIARITATNSGGAVTLNNVGNLDLARVSQLNGGDVTVSSTGNIVISGAVETTAAVELTATGLISELGTGRIAAAALATQSGGGLDLGGSNQIGRVSATNDVGLITVHNAGDLELARISQLNGGDVNVTVAGSVVVSGTVETTGGVELTATGSISETGSGRFAVASLAAQSSGGLTLDGGNQIGRINATNDGGAVTLFNTVSLELAGIKQQSGGDVLIVNGGAVAISGAVETTGSVQLTATGSIQQTGGGRIAATDLAAQSAGGLHLAGSNQIGRLTATNHGGAVTLYNAGTLDLAGIHQPYGGDVAVQNIGNIVISGAVRTTAAVELTTTGSIRELGTGRIAAAALATQSAGGLDLGGNNQIGRLFATNDGGLVAVRNTDDLELASIRQLGGDDIAVLATGSLVVSGSVETPGGVELTAAGLISEVGNGRIVATSLVTRSAGGLSLGGANRIGLLTATNDGGAILIDNGGSLELVQVVQLSGGDVAVINDGSLVITGVVETSGAVDLAVSGFVREAGAGRIVAATLTAQSAGGLDLGGNNRIDRISVSNVGGDVTFNNAADLEVLDISQLSGGDVVVQSGGDAVISGVVDTVGAVELTVAGSIAQTGGGRIAAASLTTQSAGGLLLGGDNRIGRFVGINDGGSIVLSNTGSLELGGVRQQNGGDVVVDNDGAIVIRGAVETQAAVRLNATGAVSESGAGRIVAAELSVQSGGGLHLGGDNRVDRLEVTNGGGVVFLKIDGDLELLGLKQSSGGDVTVTTGGRLVITGAVETTGTVTMTAGQSIAETGHGRIAASELAVQSAGGLDITGFNEIRVLSAANVGGAVIVNNLGALEVAGIRQLAGGDVTVTNDGALVISGLISTGDGVDLTAAGAISETGAGRVEAARLTAQSAGGLNLAGDNATGVITLINDVGAVVVVNTAGLELAGISQLSGGDVAVTAGGTLAILGAIETEGAVELAAAETITETGAGRITAAALATRSAGGLNLSGSNRIGTLSAVNDGGQVIVNNAGSLELAGIDQRSGGDVAVTNDGDLVVSGRVATKDAVDLIVTAAIKESGGGRIEAASLAVQSAGGVQLGGVNEIGIATIRNTGGGAVVVNNSGDMEIAEVRQVDGGDVVLTNDGTITIRGLVETKDAVALVAVGAVSEIGAGRIAAARLLAESGGGLTLGGDNRIGVLQATNSAGDVVLSNTGDLELAGIGQLTGEDVIVSNHGRIVISDAITTAGEVYLTAAGSVVETGLGRIAAQRLVTRSSDGIRLLGENHVARLAAYAGAATEGEAGFELRNATGQLVIEEIDAGAGFLSILQEGMVALEGSLRAESDIALTAGGSIVNVDPTGLAVIAGRSVSLLTGEGIGESERRVVVTVTGAASGTGTVNATAESGIYLKAVGDFASDLLQSRSGVLDLLAEDGVIDARSVRLAASGPDHGPVHDLGPLVHLSGEPAYARFQGRAIRIGELSYGGIERLELAFRGASGPAEHVDVTMHTGAPVVLTHLEAVEAYLTSTAHDLKMERVLIGRWAELVQGNTSVVVQVPPTGIVDADVLLYSDQPFFLTFHPDGRVSTDAVLLYVRPGSPAVPGGTQDSVVGVAQTLDRVMRQDTRAGGVQPGGGAVGPLGLDGQGTGRTTAASVVDVTSGETGSGSPAEAAEAGTGGEDSDSDEHEDEDEDEDETDEADDVGAGEEGKGEEDVQGDGREHSDD